MFSRNKKIMFVLMTNLTSEEKSYLLIKSIFFDFSIDDNIFLKIIGYYYHCLVYFFLLNKIFSLKFLNCSQKMC